MDLDAGEVAERLEARVLALAPEHDESPAWLAERREALGGALRGGRVVVAGVHHGERSAPQVLRQHGAQRAAARLAVHLHRVVARLGAERDAAADPLRGRERAGPGAAGALLAERLGARHVHLAA